MRPLVESVAAKRWRQTATVGCDMKTLKLARGLSLPIEAVTETFAILAKRGAGKSYTASVLVEQMLAAHLQVVVLDPMGIWYGLRTLADGKTAGFQIPILGGDHGDIPLEAGAGKFVADLLIAERISAVLDVSLFSKKDRKRFVADFAERLYRKNREAMHLVLEEADMFAPQRPQPGDQRMLGAVEDLVRRGRGRGVGITLISQRSAVLHKDVLTQTECLIAMRTTAPHDRRAIKDWIDAHADRDEQKKVMDSLPGLPTGTAWFWSPGWLETLAKVKINKKKTLDTGATPKAGRRRLVQKTIAEVDLTALTEKMVATIAKAEAENPTHLRKLIRERDQTIRKLQKKNKDGKGYSEHELGKKIDQAVATTAQSWQNVVTEKNREIAQLLQKMERLAVKLGAMAADVIGDHEEAKKYARQAESFPPEREKFVVPENLSATGKLTPPPDTKPLGTIRPDTSVEIDGVGNAERRVLNAIAWMNAIGVDEPNQTAVSFLAGYKSSDSGGYKNPRSRLNVLDMVEYRGKQIVMTDKGRAIALSPKVPPNAAGLHQIIFANLKGPEKKLLRLLLTAHPESIGNVPLAAAAGYDPESGGFKNPRSRLRTLGLVEYVEPGETRAQDFLFPDY